MTVATAPTWSGDASCAPCHQATYAAHAASHHANSTRNLPDTLPDGTPFLRVVGVDPVWQAIVDADGKATVAPEVFDVALQRWTLPDPPDPLPHAWSGRRGGGRGWDRQCAPCHETASASTVSAAGDVTRTAAAPHVACEACHGPASAHVDRPGPWAEGRAAANDGTCLPCHTRGATLDRFVAGAPWLDVIDPHLPGLDDVFTLDGQTVAEAFEGVPYLLSAMGHAGVACGGCHDPHDGGLRAAGDALCQTCHSPDANGVRGGQPHSHHAPGTPGDACIACHMPTQTFLGADVRHDHRLQVPDVAWARSHRQPVACDRCHTINDALAAKATAWWGDPPSQPGRDALVGAVEGRVDTSLWPTLPEPWRAAVLVALGPRPEAAALRATAAASASDLDRLGAAHALLGADDASRTAPQLLKDRRLAVRLAAARALTPHRPPSDPSMTELLSHWTGRLDQPDAAHDLGAWWLLHGNAETALPLLRRAAALDPRSGGAWRDVTLALSRLDRPQEALEVARNAVTLAADDADLWRALGLLEAAAGDVAAARRALEQAVRLAPDDPRNPRNLAALSADR
jgi:Flp pilus assembly protein TadD